MGIFLINIYYKQTTSNKMSAGAWRNVILRRNFLQLHISSSSKTEFRNVLSSAYVCEEAWNKRIESPLLKDIKMNQYFVEVDKKFATKRQVSGVDIDLFANNVRKESELEELEHLLYRFRKTKRCVEVMDSTHHATIRALLKFREYDSLLRILDDRQSYGIFPDFYCYNLMMDTFLKEKRYRDAAETAVFMMLQEIFTNPISRILGLYSCHMFLKEGTWESWDRNPKTEDEQEDDGEDVYVRVPFLRNPWFDDHFDLRNPKHLVGKTLYLIGQELDDVLGRTCQLLGLGLFEKWEKAGAFLEKISSLEHQSLLLEDSIENFMNSVRAIPDDDNNTREKWIRTFETLIQPLKGKMEAGTLDEALQNKLKELPGLEENDIKNLPLVFLEWEKVRAEALNKQNTELDCERRLKVIEEKKEYIYWKEKMLHFFENEEEIMTELAQVEKIEAEQKIKFSEESYVPPENVSAVQKKLKFKIKSVVV